jgi:hypothetical protein
VKWLKNFHGRSLLGGWYNPDGVPEPRRGYTTPCVVFIFIFLFLQGHFSKTFHLWAILATL